jgi:cellulose synthase/poly-beta-1,6-N-acetylglucosamine synthase-like glycosyltransferase
MLVHSIYEASIWVFLIYSLVIFLIYAWIGLYAFGALRGYKHKNLFTDYNLVATNPNAPRFSVIAPAYNEGMTIVENVRSLLSLYYNNLEIIIVNDGSKDDSIERLIEAYSLEPTSFFVQGQIPTENIKAVYRSKNLAFKKLLVVDKVNGGKADALNAGINVSAGDYLVCIDVDCILEQDALLKLAKPFLEQTDKRVIACGGVIRLANNCKVENGKVVDVNLPRTWLGRSQALEYIRAFVLGRMAWSRASGLILISGAFGAFDRKIVLACEGYDRNTVGEDMELVVRMRRYMEERDEPYEVVNIPDPLCWTEVPESEKVLKKQRNRWMRGTMETLWKHRKLLFNPKYGKLGLVSLPYWTLFEFLGPVIEALGYVFFIMLWLFGLINWQFFLVLCALVVTTGILYSVYSIMVDLMSHQVYTKRKDFTKLITTAVLEPFYFHPLVVRASIGGVLDYFRNKQGWGEMTRQGFQQEKEELPFWRWVLLQMERGMISWLWPSLAFLGVLSLLVGLETVCYRVQGIEVDALTLLRNTLALGFQSLGLVGVIYILFRLLNVRRAQAFLVVVYSTLSVLSLILFLYFSEGRNLLGADAFIYGKEELWHILKSSGVLTALNVGLLLFATGLIATGIYLSLFCKAKSWISGFILLFCSGVLWGVNAEGWKQPEQEAVRVASSSKLAYFFGANYDHFLGKGPALSVEEDQNFPFLKVENTPDFLGAYFEPMAGPPNIVFIVVEGLGSAYSRPEGYVGNFTPFLDSLSRSSLFFRNALSTSGRTFGMIPALTGSLPYARSGFLDLPEYPVHFNLWNVLAANGYETGFYYGGEASFDRMEPYLQKQGVQRIISRANFPEGYSLLPKSSNGESWGYEDAAVLSVLAKEKSEGPYLRMALTLSTHNPFLINESARYESRFEQRMQELGLSSPAREMARDHRKALVTVLELDDNLRQFMNSYKEREDYANTIFVITGDHAMPEIAFETKLDRYRVPLLIFSPKLKSARSFPQMVSHLDVAPSLLTLLRKQLGMEMPNSVTWVGEGLQGSKGYPLMQTKTRMVEYITPKYHWVDGENFEITPEFSEERVPEDKGGLERLYLQFKAKNERFLEKQALLPDSVYSNYFKKF